ncbi:Pentatricopeptide repeat-containing protein [Nymphaea thermarum]|nr:Pentatricopeptide repeat-containing protein [Nymphaea thermarum]
MLVMHMKFTISACTVQSFPPHSLATNPSILSLFLQCQHQNHLHQIHAHFIKTNNSNNKFYVSKLLSLYTQFDLLHHARLLFNQTRKPNTLLCNMLMKGYEQHGLFDEILHLYLHMLQEDIKPDFFTFPLVLRSCASLSALEFALSTYSRAFKSGIDANIYVQNSAIGAYCRLGCVGLARQVFDEMSEPDVVSWTTLISGYCQVGDVKNAGFLFGLMPEKDVVAWGAMISGYAQNGYHNEALSSFVEMLVKGVEATEFAIVSALSACSNLGVLKLGLSILGYVVRRGLELSVFMGTALIDMFCKCGDTTNALTIFNRMHEKNSASWNAIIGGFAMHGHAEEAIEMFVQMEEKQAVPNAITLSNVLCACTHAGLVEEGRHYFDYMINRYGIEPNVDHYGCMVDLLGRAGCVNEAYELIRYMPMEPNEVVWGALLGACRIHGNLDLGEIALEKLIELDPQNSGNYVLLANMYGELGRWEDADRIRDAMKESGVTKTPGCSSIEVNGLVHEFHAREWCHPDSTEIYEVLAMLTDHLGTSGYKPRMNRDLNSEEDCS